MKKLIVAIVLISSSLFVAQSNNSYKYDITFFVAADTHFDPPPETDQYYHIVAMNSVCGSIENHKASKWPDTINGEKTKFIPFENIDIPKGVILAGDITDRADPSSLNLLKQRYEKGIGANVINYPVYVGLGNHDLDPQHVGDKAEAYRSNMLNYISERHQGTDAPVEVTNFDSTTYNYSWDWEGVHFIQTHRFAGNIENGHVSSIPWLKSDLHKYAKDGKPVVIIQHYGFDKWSSSWWSNEEKDLLFNTIKDYNIANIFVGHNHIAENMVWNGINIFQVNNAWKDSDGNGSFLICRITNEFMNTITCRWKDGKGDIELIAPYSHKKMK